MKDFAAPHEWDYYRNKLLLYSGNSLLDSKYPVSPPFGVDPRIVFLTPLPEFLTLDAGLTSLPQ